MVRVYDGENVLVFEKKITKMGKKRLFVEVPAALKNKVQRDAIYLVVMIPVKQVKIIER